MDSWFVEADLNTFNSNYISYVCLLSQIKYSFYAAFNCHEPIKASLSGSSVLCFEPTVILVQISLKRQSGDI